jgi:micrococcal nuclease
LKRGVAVARRLPGLRRTRAAIVWSGVVIAVLLIGRFASQPDPRTGSVPPDEWVGPCGVTWVVDGDTLDVTCPTFRDRVRLLRINTPERERRGYERAKNALEILVEDREVTLTFEELGTPERGGSGRLLAYVYVGDLNVNVEMVRLGWSRFWTKYGKGRFANQFRDAEREARREQRGLWARR